MTSILNPPSEKINLTVLYATDYYRWTEMIAQQLKQQQSRQQLLDPLDYDHLIEEIEALGRSQKRELKSRLRELLEHILKRTYVTMPYCYRGWVESIDKQRSSLRDLLADSPSLKPFWSEVFDEVYQEVFEIVSRRYPHTNFPKVWPFSKDIQSLLREDFWLP